ncbi:MAG: type III pantothenate kinase [Verrucomicrobiales bacterium]|jgi:type III pantothenate kinase
MPAASHYLLIDISNSMTKLAPSSVMEIEAEPLLIPTGEITAEVLRGLPWQSPPGGFSVVLSSVVPDKDKVIEEAFGSERILKVSHSIELGILIDYPAPETIGADRLANAAAAVCYYGTPAVVVDFGTAVTFDIISESGAYVGGVIAPGLAAMTEYMFEHTALLPRIDLEEPASVIGKSTKEAMQAGAVLGYRGLVKDILVAITDEMGCDAPPVIATGGYATLITNGIPAINLVHHNLTLDGLRIIAGLNSSE